MRTFNLIRQLEAMSGAATSSAEVRWRHGGIGGRADPTAGTRPGRWNCGGPSWHSVVLLLMRHRRRRLLAQPSRYEPSGCAPPQSGRLPPGLRHHGEHVGRRMHGQHIAPGFVLAGHHAASGLLVSRPTTSMPSCPPSFAYAHGSRDSQSACEGAGRRQALSMANARRRRRGGDQFTDTPS